MADDKELNLLPTGYERGVRPVDFPAALRGAGFNDHNDKT